MVAVIQLAKEQRARWFLDVTIKNNSLSGAAALSKLFFVSRVNSFLDGSKFAEKPNSES